MKNFAHRGYREKYPENTMLAFEKAIEYGADGVEFDVHLTKDGQAVIIHDETLDRTTDFQGHVRDYSLKELKKADAAHYLGQPVHQEIPTLKEYFEMVKDLDFITNIELKTGIIWYEGIERVVYDLIRAYGLEERVIISSFNHKSVLAMKKLDPRIKCGFLVDDWLINPAAYLKKHSIECYHPPIYSLDQAEVRKLQEEGLEVNAWHGKEGFDISQAMELGIDALISDYTEKVAAAIRGGQKSSAVDS